MAEAGRAESVGRLLFTNAASGAVWRSNFNIQEWKPALAVAGLISDAGSDGKYESAREHGMHALRHFYASVRLDAGGGTSRPSANTWGTPIRR